MNDLQRSRVTAGKSNYTQIVDSNELHKEASFEEKKAVYANRLAEIFGSDAPMSLKITWAMQCAQEAVAGVEKSE